MVNANTHPSPSSLLHPSHSSLVSQVRKYEAEVSAVKAAKERERALAEWQAEQEKESTLALLDPAEAQRQRDRSGPPAR